MRILFITNDFPTKRAPGNAPCIKEQMTQLQKRHIEVDLLNIDTVAGKLRAYVFAACRIFLINFGNKRYDLVHAFYGHCGLMAQLQFRCPVVVTFRGSDLLHHRDKIIGRVAAKLADRAIVMSQEMVDASGRDDAVIIPFGVNMSVFRPYSMELARRELGLRPHEKLILFPWNPGRPEKRYDIVEAAVQNLKEKIPNTRLVLLFGKPHETVARFMNACNVMVLASDYEGAPVAIREAMACNLPIVSVDVGDVRQLISGTDNCLLCERNSDDMAQALATVIATGERSNGFSVMSQFDTGHLASEVISTYMDIASDGIRSKENENTIPH